MSQTPILSLQNLGFAWPKQSELLDISELNIHSGEHVFLKGPSGSGKTTLLGLIAGISQAQRGQVRLLGADLGQMRASHRDRFRADHSGYIFQQFNLLPFLSVEENVSLACGFSALRRQRAQKQHGSVSQAAAKLLEQLGLEPAIYQQQAAQLSIGQQQRVACARALIGQPELVIADEPTSALDADSRDAFLQLLFSQCRASGAGLLFVSHDQSLAAKFDRSLNLAEINQAAGA